MCDLCFQIKFIRSYWADLMVTYTVQCKANADSIGHIAGSNLNIGMHEYPDYCIVIVFFTCQGYLNSTLVEKND